MAATLTRASPYTGRLEIESLHTEQRVHLVEDSSFYFHVAKGYRRRRPQAHGRPCVGSNFKAPGRYIMRDPEHGRAALEMPA